MIRTLVLAALLLPGLGAQEQRQSIDAARLPWSAVVRVQIPGVSVCTGFAVAPRLVATAAHCLYGRRLGRMMPPESVHVLSGYDRDSFARHSVAASYRVAPGFIPGQPHRMQASDVALLTLAAPLGGAVLAPVPAISGQRAMLGGYSQDRGQALTADTGCRVLGRVRDSTGQALELHDCEATFGSSGAPLLVRLANGAWEAGGVQVGVIEDRVGGVAAPASVVQALMP